MANLRIHDVAGDDDTTRPSANLEALNTVVEGGQSILEELKTTLQCAPQTEITTPWLRQIDAIKSPHTRVIVGVVGATGSGKSSIINALLGEKQLVPTNCMRACTAVVTEISWNGRDEKQCRAAIDFISKDEWHHELKVLLDDVACGGNTINDADSPAGIAFAKMIAVYPYLTQHTVLNTPAEVLMQKPQLSCLGTVRELEGHSSEELFRSIRVYIDSKDKLSSGFDTMEYWPLIRKVSIYTKAPVLETGCVLVDLPGIADSNAARAAVARDYLQNCTALWIVAPIIRAVDDKSAKYLLGEGFRRQLQRDGTYDRISFICSKTDDINLKEARSVLAQDPDFARSIVTIDRAKDAVMKDRADLVTALTSARQHFEELTEKNSNLIRKEKAYKQLKSMAAQGTTVHPPLMRPMLSTPSKRQRSVEEVSPRTPKRSKAQQYLSQTNESPLGRYPLPSTPSTRPADNNLRSDIEDSYEQDMTKPRLTVDSIENKLEEIKASRSQIRDEKKSLKEQKDEFSTQLTELKEIDKELREQEWVAYVLGRNQHSSGFIREDFSAGVQDLNQDEAEDDEDFDAEKDMVRVQELGKALRVFCVSSVGFQRLEGRMDGEKVVDAFSELQETGIPALHEYAYQLGASEMLVAGESYVGNVQRLLTSLQLWSSGVEGVGIDPQGDEDEKKHRNLIDNLVQALSATLETTLNDIEAKVTTNVISRLPRAVRAGINESLETAARWGAPRSKADPNSPGLACFTYRATVRRNGLFTNSARKNYNFNEDLAKPFMKKIDARWGGVFNESVGQLLRGAIEDAGALVDRFQQQFIELMNDKGVSSNVRKMFHDQLTRFAKSVGALFQGAKQNIRSGQKVANRLCEETIKTEMHTVYSSCAAERGDGTRVRMVEKMKGHLEANVDEMFKDVKADIESALVAMLKRVRGTAVAELQSSCQSLDQDCTYLVSKKGREFAGLAQNTQEQLQEIIREADASFRSSICAVKQAVADGAVVQPISLPLRSIQGCDEWGELEEPESGVSDSDGEMSDIEC